MNSLRFVVEFLRVGSTSNVSCSTTILRRFLCLAKQRYAKGVLYLYYMRKTSRWVILRIWRSWIDWS